MTVTEQALSLVDISDPAACGPDDCAPATDRTVELDERSADDVRRLVRGARRPDPGPAAAHRLDLSLRGHAGRRPCRSAGDQPVDVFPPRQEARRGGVRRGRQGRHRQRRFGQPGLLHRPPPRRRRGDGHAGHRALLPRGPSRRRQHARHDRRRPRDRPRHLRRGLATRNATFETKSPVRPAAGRQVAPRSPLGRRARRRRRRLGRCRARSATATATPASPRPASTSPRPRAAAASASPCSTARSPRPTPAACGRCRPRSSPRTAPPSPCTTRPATAPWRSARGSRSSTASGGTRCSSSVVASAIDPARRRAEPGLSPTTGPQGLVGRRRRPLNREGRRRSSSARASRHSASQDRPRDW